MLGVRITCAKLAHLNNSRPGSAASCNVDAVEFGAVFLSTKEDQSCCKSNLTPIHSPRLAAPGLAEPALFWVGETVVCNRHYAMHLGCQLQSRSHGWTLLQMVFGHTSRRTKCVRDYAAPGVTPATPRRDPLSLFPRRDTMLRKFCHAVVLGSLLALWYACYACSLPGQ